MINPKIFDSNRIASCMTTRRGGVSPEPYGMNVSFEVGDIEANVIKNRDKMLSFLGAGRDSLAYMKQVHSHNVQLVKREGIQTDTDAIVCNTRGVVLAVTVADCLPILLHDPMSDAIAAIHAGWRGCLSGIVLRSLDKMRELFETLPGNVLVHIGAGAGSCCYEVQSNVAHQFNEEVLNKRSGSMFLDLRKHVRKELISAGVLSSNIEENTDCTICKSDTYHSYRREKNLSGRMMACIMLK